MNKIWCILLLATSIACANAGNVSIITLQNPTDRNRVDEAFVIKRENMKPTNNKLVPAIKTTAGVYVPSQLDDLNKDGQWDELAFVYTLSSREKVNLGIVWIDLAKYPKFKARTNVRYGKMTKPGVVESLQTDVHGRTNLPRGEGYPYQMDGPAWENDKVGFRHYFDGRNCRDVFGKRLPTMALDTVGIRPNGTPGDTYHVMSDWGRDILGVAKSFGLGGLALQLPDTLLRLGIVQEERTDNVDSTRFTILSKGPVRSVFTFDYYGWQVKNKKVNVHNTVTIWAGKYGCENVVKTSALPNGALLVTGIVTSNNGKEVREKAYNGKFISMSTHDMQTYDKVWYLGMSLIMPAENMVRTFNAPKVGPGVSNTWCASIKPNAKGEYRYNCYAAWEISDQRFRDRNFYLGMIDGYAQNMLEPVVLSIK
ncbi:MAG: DUF4861 domain-containing protein [Bacteroidales bacterium]|nr:DUF4861 domain-containing protein [Bacteroidales bacterium]